MDIQLYYTKTGSGFPLLLLHGNGEESGYFERQIPEFAQTFTVYAIDTRWHGRSPRGTAPFTLSQFADDLRDFMEEHDLPRADILGFSDGGNIALIFALRYPERVRRLVLNAANLCPEGMEPWLLEDLQREHRNLRDNPGRVRDTALLELMLKEPHIDPAELATLTCPTLVIAGDHDMILEEHTRLIAASIPGAKLAIVPGPHDCAYRNPAPFNKAVQAFFKETEESL